MCWFTLSMRFALSADACGQRYSAVKTCGAVKAYSVHNDAVKLIHTVLLWQADGLFPDLWSTGLHSTFVDLEFNLRVHSATDHAYYEGRVARVEFVAMHVSKWDAGSRSALSVGDYGNCKR